MRDPRFIPDLEDLDWDEDYERPYPLDDEGIYIEDDEDATDDWYFEDEDG